MACRNRRILRKQTWEEAPQRPCGFAIVNQIPKCSANGGRKLLHAAAMPSFGQQTFDIVLCLVSIGGRLGCSQSWPQPAPKRRSYQQLFPPATETLPFRRIMWPSKPATNRSGGFLQDAVTVESFDDCRCGIPAVWKQPVRQQTHSMAAYQTQESLDPHIDPSGFGKPADLTRIHAMTNHLESSIFITGCLSAIDAMRRTNLVARWSVRTSRAQLLDSSSETM
jgi:hypothetical protein